jgi:hypothetical protein
LTGYERAPENIISYVPDSCGMVHGINKGSEALMTRTAASNAFLFLRFIFGAKDCF